MGSSSPSRPASVTATMFGCCRRPSARCSLRRRATMSSRPARSLKRRLQHEALAELEVLDVVDEPHAARADQADHPVPRPRHDLAWFELAFSHAPRPRRPAVRRSHGTVSRLSTLTVSVEELSFCFTRSPSARSPSELLRARLLNGCARVRLRAPWPSPATRFSTSPASRGSSSIRTRSKRCGTISKRSSATSNSSESSRPKACRKPRT
jgi:hypothetical protein